MDAMLHPVWHVVLVSRGNGFDDIMVNCLIGAEHGAIGWFGRIIDALIIGAGRRIGWNLSTPSDRD
ncbi:hypothetical protein [Rhodopila sp.]|uniref:hypothetical protein n=1 Tax=Rhodopila sp. TaxID=2480087 RepID=UPI003D0F7C28